MTTRTLRYTASASIAVLALGALLSCSTTSNDPGDPGGPPGPGAEGGGNSRPPAIIAIIPEEVCSVVGLPLSIVGDNLVDTDIVATVLVNGVPATVTDRFDGGFGASDVITVSMPNQSVAIPPAGLSVNVEVRTGQGSDVAVQSLRLLPSCTAAPILVSVDPSTGGRNGFDTISLRGDNLACVERVQFVSTGGGPTLEADLVAILSDQELLAQTPATNDPSSAPYQIIVTSDCGANVAPRPTFQYTGSGGSATVPDGTAIFDTTTSLPQGPAIGGNQVRITGRDLDLATSVRIGTTTLRAPADFIITATGDILILAMPPSPAGSSTSVPIAVTVVGASGPDPTPLTYTYIGQGAPRCIGISPNSGPIGGGTNVTITGLNLNDVTQVLFGGMPDGGLFYPTVDGSAIVAVTPGYGFPVDVDVVLQVGASPNFSTIATCTPARFTYVDVNADPPFSVTGINPDAGPQTGGTTIVIAGTGLDDVTSVRICDVVATINSALADQVIATTGIFGGTVPFDCDVVVSTNTGLSATLSAPDGFRYLPVVPDAQAFAPGSAQSGPQAGGTSFRLQGINLIGVTQVRFGGQPLGSLACELQVQGNTQVSGTAPAYLTPTAQFPATVAVFAESDAGVDSTPLLFTYYANPTIADARGPLNDDRVDSGNQVSVIGNNFRPAGDDFVEEIVLSNTGVIAGATAGSEEVVLQPGEFTIVSNSLITFDFPPSIDLFDWYDVTIKTPRQGADCVSDYSRTAVQTLFFGQPPSASRVQPDQGRFQGGTTVVITGDFSLPVNAVTICGVPQNLGARTPTTMTITTQPVSEASAGTACDVVITNTSGASDPIPSAFTFIADPDPATGEVATVNCRTLVSSPAAPIPVKAGQVLTLRGTDFGAPFFGINSVTIGGVAATIVESTHTDTRLDVIVPPTPAGGPAFDVALRVVFAAAPGGVADTPYADLLPQIVDYLGTPTITTLLPASIAAGQQVTITGTELLNVDGSNPIVKFNGVNANVVPGTATATTVKVVVPAGTPGQTVPVTLETCQGTATTSFTYPCNTPAIANYGPTQGGAGTLVTITGSDLINFDGTRPTVTFGGVAATVQTFAAGTVTVLAPSGTVGSSVNVVLTTCGGSVTASPQFLYQCAPPTVGPLTPAVGRAGTTVVISGSNLDQATVVLFGAAGASIVSSTPTSITVTAPAGAGLVNVSVTTCGGTTVAVGAFTYCAVPNATGVAPATGPEGQAVTITGTGLTDPDLTAPTVTFQAPGGPLVSATVVSATPTTVQVQAPAGVTGVANVTVTTCGGSDLAGTFRYCPAPTITSISPSGGAAGTQVSIVGTNLVVDQVPATIRFGGTLVTTVTLATDTLFVVQAPAGPTGQVVVTATTCGGTAQSLTLYSYCTTPVVTGLVPNNGAATDEVTIFGTNLVGADGVPGTVRFLNTTATVLTSSPTQITVQAPGGFAAGAAVQVRVTTCGGVSAIDTIPPLDTVFTYQGSTTCVSPVVTTISPTAGAAGSSLTVTGSNLIGNDGNAGTVRIGGSPPIVPTAATPTQLVVTVPAGAGSVGVTVTTCGGSAQAPQLFTYCTPPTLTLLTPASGAAGATVLLDGTFLVGANGVQTQVFFGLAAATLVDATATRLTVLAPGGILAGTTVNVRAVTCGGTTASLPFQYVATTTFDVTAITPIAGPRSGGQQINLTGSGLNGAGGGDIASIAICNVDVASFTQVSDTLVQATTGAFAGPAPTTCDVVVTLVDGRSDTLTGAYTYQPVVPDGRLFDNTPAGGSAVNAPAAGGTAFRIAGINMRDTNKVFFGGVAGQLACNLEPATDTYITGVAPQYITPIAVPVQVEVYPASVAGVDDTTVEVPPAAPPVVLFTYYPNPTLTGPFVGNPFQGGDLVIVNGTNFTDPSGADVFIADSVIIKNTGTFDEDNYPEDTDYDFRVGISITSPSTFEFFMPFAAEGDVFTVTIETINQGLGCVADYSYTLSGLVVVPEVNCADLADDDGDGLVDCIDPDCEAEPACP